MNLPKRLDIDIVNSNNYRRTPDVPSNSHVASSSINKSKMYSLESSEVVVVCPLPMADVILFINSRHIDIRKKIGI